MASEKVAVVGLGYVGLPLACVLAESGFFTIGVDIDIDRVSKINNGDCPIAGDEPGLNGLLLRTVSEGRLKAVSKMEEARSASAFFVCVDTPIDEDHKPKLEQLRAALVSVGNVIQRGCLISIESTLPPGTMENIVLPILEERSGLKAGIDFSLVHCPERVMPGKLLQNMRGVERVLGGLDEESIRKGAYYYSKVVQAEIHPTDLPCAEISKTTGECLQRCPDSIRQRGRVDMRIPGCKRI